jgi:cell division protein FtsL
MSTHAVPVSALRPLPGRRGTAAQSQVAGFHRERDRRRLLAMLRTLMCAGVLVSLVLAVVGVRLHQVRLAYRLDGLRAVRAELEESTSRLRVEVGTLSSLARIEGKARTELGMVPPTANQVRLAREFMPGGDGLSLAVPLTASADRRDAPAVGAR